MPTPFDDLYAAAQAIMADVNTAATTTVTAAPTNYGTDFRITAGEARYQVQISPEKDWPRGTVNYPRAVVTVLIHLSHAEEGDIDPSATVELKLIE